MKDELLDELADLCARAISALPPESEHRAALQEIVRQAGEPLRVAVAGRLKAGKSTLVNALLGQRVAPVAGSECTRVVTIFRYSARERVTVTPRSGAEWEVGLTADGRLPQELGVPPGEVAHITAWLSNNRLEKVTLIDTPGLDSLDRETSAATGAVLGLDSDSDHHVRGADALIFLLPHLLEQDESYLSRFARQLGNTASSPTTTLAVLSRVDQLTADGDPWPVANSTASALQAQLGRSVFSVLPLIGLLAETGAADAFTEHDASALRRLAELPPDRKRFLVLSVDDFVEFESEVPVEHRQRLMDLLGLHGVRRALDLIESDRSMSGPDLIARLRAESGFARLDDAIQEIFLRRSEALRATIHIDALERLAYQLDPTTEAEAAQILTTELASLRSHPTAHAADEVETLRALRNDELRLGPSDRTAAERLLTGVGPGERLGLASTARAGEVAELTLEEAARWQRIENDPRSDGPTRTAATTLRGSLMILWEATQSSSS